MKRVWGLVILAGSILAFAAFQAPPNGAPAQLAPNDELSRRFIQTTSGTVKSYSAGERIVLVAEDGSEVTMALDEGARVDDSIAEGGQVTVAWLADSLGRIRVTSIAPISAAVPDGAASGSSSSSPPSKAYAAAESGGMSTTPSGSMASTPEPPLSGTPRARAGTPAYSTPGLTVSPARTMPPGTVATPGASPRTTPPSGSN